MLFDIKTVKSEMKTMQKVLIHRRIIQLIIKIGLQNTIVYPNSLNTMIPLNFLNPLATLDPLEPFNHLNPTPSTTDDGIAEPSYKIQTQATPIPLPRPPLEPPPACCRIPAARKGPDDTTRTSITRRKTKGWKSR